MGASLDPIFAAVCRWTSKNEQHTLRRKGCQGVGTISLLSPLGARTIYSCTSQTFRDHHNCICAPENDLRDCRNWKRVCGTKSSRNMFFTVFQTQIWTFDPLFCGQSKREVWERAPLLESSSSTKRLGKISLGTRAPNIHLKYSTPSNFDFWRTGVHPHLFVVTHVLNSFGFPHRILRTHTERCADGLPRNRIFCREFAWEK